jgi:hypothetical protein
MIIEKAKSFFYDDVKITDKCTFPEGHSKILPLRTLVGIVPNSGDLNPLTLVAPKNLGIWSMNPSYR